MIMRRALLPEMETFSSDCRELTSGGSAAAVAAFTAAASASFSNFIASSDVILTLVVSGEGRR